MRGAHLGTCGIDRLLAIAGRAVDLLVRGRNLRARGGVGRGRRSVRGAGSGLRAAACDEEPEEDQVEVGAHAIRKREHGVGVKAREGQSLGVFRRKAAL